MYDPVHGRKKARSRRHRWVWLLSAVLILAVFIPVVFMVVRYTQAYAAHQDFLADLSRSTVRNYTLGALEVTDGSGRAYTLTGEDIYAPYNALANAGMGRPESGPPPQTADTLTFHYYKRAVLQVWSVPIGKNSTRADGLYVRYTYFGGQTYSYTTDRFSFGQFRSLCAPTP